MVVTFLPCTRESGATQERAASPSMCTVQAPHSAMPQPYLVPVSPRWSRRTHSSGVEGSASTCTDLPFTEKLIMRRSWGQLREFLRRIARRVEKRRQPVYTLREIESCACPARNFPARPSLSPNVPQVTDKNSTRHGLSGFRRHRIAILLAIAVAIMTA